MSVTVRLSEEHGRPEDAALELREGVPLLVYLLPPHAGLRRTLLRAGDRDRPSEVPALPGCAYLLRILPDGAGGTIKEIAPGVLVERPGEAHDEQLQRGVKVRSGDHLRVRTADGDRVALRLVFDLREQPRVEQAVGAWRTREEGPTFNLAREVWALPSAWEGLTDPMRGLNAGARRVGARLGLSPAALGLLVGALGLLVAAGTGLWAQARAVDAAEARASAAEAERSSADQARLAANGSEAACLEEKASVVAKLGEQHEAKRAALSAWLGLGAARSQALRLAPGLAAVPDRGDELVDDLLAMDPPMTVPGEEAEACLRYTAELGPDLPRYVLAWHPTHKLVCPEGYDETVDGVRWKGRWGLSDRVVAVLGDGGEGDPRDSDARAAAILGRGVREVLNALLTAPTERPAVVPSQAQLWALALFEAYNRLPMEPEGVRMAGPGECVRGWLEESLNATSDNRRDTLQWGRHEGPNDLRTWNCDAI